MELCHGHIQIDLAPVHGMPKHFFEPLRGRVERFCFDSSLLENKLGDPTEREILVHTSHEAQQILAQGESLPVLIYLAPFTSSGPARAGWKAFSETILQRHERLVKEGKMKPVFLVLPDTFTSLGGNQFVDSPLLGQWATWLSTELQEQMHQRFSVNGTFCLLGKSSGGYGAMVNAMLFPKRWVGIASHSGDVGFEYMYKHDFYHTLRRLQQWTTIGEFLEHTKSISSISHEMMHDMMMVALAASYDPPSSLNIDDIVLPLTTLHHQLDEKKWARWTMWDPLKMVEANGDALKELGVLFIDCGRQDQYNIQYGSRLLHHALRGLDIVHIYEEFEGTHSGIDHRLDLSLAKLSQL
ncbi:MAG: alpha/beta hydrolase-fold protein [Candidatus Poseidoniales archaeon]